MRRRMWWGIGGGLVASAVVAVVFARQRAADVDVGVVSEGALAVTVSEVGTTRVRGHADVHAPVAGRWVPAALEVGDTVRAGTLLGVLYPVPMDPTARAQARARVGAADAIVREADANVARARTAVEEAARTLRRAERVGAAGGMAPQEVERARDALTTGTSELESATMRSRAAAFERAAARAVLASTNGSEGAVRIVAPLSGSLLQWLAEHERVVSPGTPLAEVGDARDLEVLVPMLTTDAARVLPDAPVALVFGRAADSVTGRVRRVEPSAFTKVSALGVDEQRVNVVVTAPATGAHIGAQFRAQAWVTVWSTPQATRVPVAALMRDAEQWFVFALDGNGSTGRVRRRAVTVGERNDELAEVRGGLAVGTRVVLYPGDALRDGTRVRAREPVRTRRTPE